MIVRSNAVASIDTRNGIVAGHVIAGADPAVEQEP